MQDINSLSSHKKTIKWHISSKYTSEMSKQSRVVSYLVNMLATYVRFNVTLQVPLGVQLLNENKTDEMCLIMKNLHKDVPKKTYKITYHLNEDFDCTEECYHRILFGGDQLTVCRARGAKFARANDDLSDERFDGLIPVTEDWHARMTLLRVSANCVVYLEL